MAQRECANGCSCLIGRILTFVMTGIALVIVARLLGPSQYGVYTLAVAFASIFGSIGYFGIGTAVNKFVSESKQRKGPVEIDNVAPVELTAWSLYILLTPIVSN